MEDSESLSRFLNICLLHLQKIELELKCPICLNLLNLPILLPCNHIFCSQCITTSTIHGSCPVCKLPFVPKDLRLAPHMGTMVNIYTSMNAAFGANHVHRESRVDMCDTKTPPSERPLPVNKTVGANLQEELVHNTVGEKSSNMQPCAPSFGNGADTSKTRDGETNEMVMCGNKNHVYTREHEAFVNLGDPYSPPSFGDIKDSDDEIHDQGSEHSTKRLPAKGSCKNELKAGATVKTEVVPPSFPDPSTSEKQHSGQLNEAMNRRPTSETKEDNVGKSKRQKFNSPLDDGSPKGGSNAKLYHIHHEDTSKDASVFTSESESEHERRHNNQPLPTFNHLDTNVAVECAFCHSFRTTEASGEMLHYVNGKPTVMDQTSQSNCLHVHQKCIDWAPQVYFAGETAMNLEAELARAAKIKCSSCGLKGAALGCYVKSCRRSFHVPCAVEIPECRWDGENFLVLCPTHTSHKLPCDRSKTGKKIKANHSSSAQIDCSSLSGDLISPSKQQCDELWAARSSASREWILCGSALSTEEKDLLDKFSRLTSASVTKGWKPDVTHIIASTDENGGCGRTLKVLMAILSGKWVLNVDWVKACMEARHPVAEEPYEISHDVHGCFGGPRNGRTRVVEKAPKLFAGLCFYFSGYFMPSYKGYLEELILAAGGTVLKKNDFSVSQSSNAMEISRKAYVVYNVDPPQGCNHEDLTEVVTKRHDDAEAFAAKSGSCVIDHTSILETIAACNLQSLASVKTSVFV